MQHINMEALKEYAYELLSCALEVDSLIWYAVGIPLFSIKMGAEGEECNFIKMEAIYQYYKDHPDSKINKRLEAELMEYAPKLKADYCILNILGMIMYQLEAEAENRAPFTMDTKTMIKRFNKNLHKNFELYQTEHYQKVGFWDKVMQLNESFVENFGLHLW